MVKGLKSNKSIINNQMIGNKSTLSLTTQLRDVAQAFYLKVWGEAFNATGVRANSDLKGSDKVYYPLTLSTTPSSTLPSPDRSFTSSVPKSLTAPTFEPSTKKEK